MDERMESLNEIRSLAPEAVRQMEDMLGNPKTSPMVKIRIMEMILDRTFGRPEAAVKLSTTQQNVEAAQARLERIFGHVKIE